MTLASIFGRKKILSRSKWSEHNTRIKQMICRRCDLTGVNTFRNVNVRFLSQSLNKHFVPNHAYSQIFKHLFWKLLLKSTWPNLMGHVPLSTEESVKHIYCMHVQPQDTQKVCVGFSGFRLQTQVSHWVSSSYSSSPEAKSWWMLCSMCGLGLACTTWVMNLSSTERLQHAWPAGNTDALCAAPSVTVAIRKFSTGSTSPALMLSGCIREKCWIQGH